MVQKLVLNQIMFLHLKIFLNSNLQHRVFLRSRNLKNLLEKFHQDSGFNCIAFLMEVRYFEKIHLKMEMIQNII